MSVEPSEGLPPGWTRATLDEVADVQLGKMLDRAKRTQGTPLPYVRNINVRWGHVDLSDLLEMPFKGEELERYGLKDGDVLVCEGGEPGRAAVWNQGATDIKYQKAIHRVRLFGEIESPWLVYSLQYDAERGALDRRFTGTTIKHFTRQAIRQYPFPIAPVPEQVRIIAALEEQLSKLDAAVAGLARAQAHLKRYRASVLKAAVEGRLVPPEAELARQEGRDYEPAKVLLDRILSERRRYWVEAEAERAEMKAKGKARRSEKFKAKFSEPAPPDTSGMLDLPEGWCWASIYQVSELTAGYGFPKALQGRPEGDFPFFKVGDISRAWQSGMQSLTQADHYVSSDDLSRLKARPLPKGTTVFAKIGAAIALNRRALLSQPSLVDNNVFGVSPALEIDPEFLFYVICTMAFGEDSRATTVPSLRKDDVGLRPFPLPPLAEQKRVVEALGEAISSEHRLRTVAEANIKRVERLRQSIFKWAFEGKLVDQDPSDEPASALLSRIEAEREAAANLTKANRRGRQKARATRA